MSALIGAIGVAGLAGQAWAGGRVVLPPVSAPLVSAAPVASALPQAGPVAAQLLLPLPGLALRPVLGPAAAAPVPVVGGVAAAALPLAALARAGERGGAAFDGGRRPEAVQLELPFPGLNRASDTKPPAAGPPRYLSIADPAHGRWLGEVVRAAWTSRTGRRVLSQVARLSNQRGRPISVFLTDLRANNGEYVYDWDMIQLGQHYLKKDPVEAAPTLVHELLHVVQKSLVLPTDAIEMELEAYMVTFDVMRELGVPFEKGSFYKSAYRKFQGPLPEFVKWLTKEYSGNYSLIGSRLSKYVAALEKRRDKYRRSLARLDKRIASTRKAIEEMARTGQDAAAIETYRGDALAKLEMDKRQEELNLSWVERDLKMLATPDGRERYRAYARRVMSYTRKVHARYNAGRAAGS